MKRAVISLSGGMDSTCLLMQLLAEGYQVNALSFDYGQNHSIELQRLRDNIAYLSSQEIHINWNLISLKEIGLLFESALLRNNIAKIPEGHYEQENMKATVVPNRNAIFSSIIYGYALSVYKKFGDYVEVFLGVHSGDHEIYPDCRPEFYSILQRAFEVGNWDSEKIAFSLPYLHGNKTTILQDCLKSCKALNLDFDTILGNTNTSYNPDELGRSSGTSGADIERIEAFINIGRKDPVLYVKPWEEIVEHAKGVLNIT